MFQFFSSEIAPVFQGKRGYVGATRYKLSVYTINLGGSAGFTFILFELQPDPFRQPVIIRFSKSTCYLLGNNISIKLTCLILTYLVK